MSVERRIVFWAAALAAFLLFMFVFSPILLPFVAGMALAYMLDPVADWFERRGFSRLAATMTILILFVVVLVAFLLLVVPILINQLTTLVADFPGYVKRIEELIEKLLTSSWAENLGVDPDTVRASISDYLSQGSRWFTTVIPSIWSGGIAFINVLALAVVTPVVAFYMLYDWDRMVDKVDSWLPRDNVEEIRGIAREIDRVIAGFVRGQALVGLSLGTFYATGLVTIGVNFGFLIGLVAGIISFIPYVGTTLGFVASVGIALVQFWPDWIWIVATAVLFVIGQLLEGYVFQPYFIGGNVGLHPVWLMFALFAFGLLFGFVGLLVAIPAAAAIGVLVRYALGRYLQSPIYRGDGKAREAAKSRKR
jgi:predicted PurR-regulated permease PerM